MPKVDDTQENFDTCMRGNCSSCPSYPAEAREGLYCARGYSKSSVVKKGCNCPECPVWADNSLSGMYYCAKRDKI